MAPDVNTCAPQGKLSYTTWREQTAREWLDRHTQRRFKLLRMEDLHGVSGEGIVAEGIQFSDGSACIRWIVGDHRTTTPHDSIESVEHIHGHDGRTVVVWMD